MGRSTLSHQGPNDAQNVTETELSDLRQKFTLLDGDRKAYYEMSMHTMKENKRSIACLRDENKNLRRKLAGLQRQARTNSKNTGELASDSELRDLEKNVVLLRRNYDTLKAAVDDKRQALRKLRDEAGALELEAKRPNSEDSPLTRKIRMLENRLDKAMIKYNEAQSIRKTYEQIVKRLKEERVGFDNQLAAVERTLQAKQHDHEELLLLSGDATHAREVAAADLERARASITESRKERERELRGKKEIVNARSDLVNRLEQREQKRNEIKARAQGDLSEEEEQSLKKSLALNSLTQTKMVEDTKHQKAKIDIYEDAFRKIKDATGVSDVNEVIQKIISQEDTQRNLKDLTKENQGKIEQLQAEKHSLAHRVEEIKYSGTGGGHRRKMVDDHEENLSQSVAKLERCRLRYERLAKILINVKAGINHLADKLEMVQQDNKHIAMMDDTILDILVSCENTLTTILTKINEDSQVNLDKQQYRHSLLSTIEDDEVAASRPFNQRVNLPDPSAEDFGRNGSKLNEDSGSAHNDMESIDMPLDEEGEEELTRDRIKKASQTIILTHEKKQRKKKRSVLTPPTSSSHVPSQSSSTNTTSSRAGTSSSPSKRRTQSGRRTSTRGGK